MKTIGTLSLGLVLLSLVILNTRLASGADKPPHITSISVPQGGATTIIFHGTLGPFRIQKRVSIDPEAPWLDVPEAQVTEIQPGVFMGLIARDPRMAEDLAFYRVVSERETVSDLKGWTFLVQVSAPANRQFFVPGESPVLTVKILDTFAQGITRDDFSTFNLYLYGPQDPQQTVTASKLLNATTDRTKTPHHYINLKTNPDVKVSGNVLTYPLRAVTDEMPGTYTVSLWSVLAVDNIQQIMKFADLQIGTPQVESAVVAKVKCAACHEGPISGKTYLHHVDVSPSRPGSVGNWSLDYEPVKTCKSCHNNEGYAAYRVVTATSTNRVPDPIIRRVHGVHMGEHLKLPFNNDPVKGDFKDYIHVGFPADVRDCTKCHVDDRWKTEVSQLACGTCHDNIWFGPKPTPDGWLAHAGGAQANDNNCLLCHDVGGLGKGVAEAHQVAPPAFKQVVKLEMTSPANGKFYIAGETPKVIVKITDAATGQVINPSSIVEPLISTNVAPNEWRRGYLYVSGPRSRTVPVLTTAAAQKDPTRSYANNDLRVRLDKVKEDPRLIRTADSMIYQLDDVAKLAPGTYTTFVEFTPASGLGGWAYQNFQVGTAAPEPMIATNCRDCHEDTRMHGTAFAATFTPDICKNCHDYERQTPGKITWADRNQGFGAAPLARRVHGVHFGNYLDKPLEIHQRYGEEFGHIIFPQDIRNCTKCHAESNTWKEKPSRIACLACHDSDAAKTHAQLLTYTPDPADPYGPTAVETCVVCHGAGSEFSADKVHNLSNPYLPPYPRAPREEELRVLTPLEAANVGRGGSLYDTWWAVTGAAEPSTDHPLWASRPDKTSNTRKGSITWRCKECHGWDYKGVDGAYGSGSHRTGIRGIYGTPKTAQEVFDLVKTSHAYGAAGLNDASIWDLVKFVLQGQIDAKTIIDANRKFTGNVAKGETLYNSGIGSSTSCKTCHGLDGLTPPPDYPAFTEYPGKLANENPWEFLHKVRFGQPGTTMPGAVAGGGALQDVADVAAYSQTLPKARLVGAAALRGARRSTTSAAR